MSLRCVALGLSFFVLVSCQPKKASYTAPANPETVVTSDAIREIPAPPVETRVPQAEIPEPETDIPTPVAFPIPPAPPPVEIPCEGTKLLIATDKLGPGLLKAQVEFNGTFQEVMFTPGPKSSILCLKGLTETEGSLLTLRLLQNTTVKFIAKRSNTSYKPFLTSQIVIDSCLILQAPWDGQTHDGSCEWTISELPHSAY